MKNEAIMMQLMCGDVMSVARTVMHVTVTKVFRVKPTLFIN